MQIQARDIRRILANPLFLGVDGERAERIFEECGCYVVNFSDGDTLLAPDCTERTAGIVLSGKATVTTPDPARKTLLRYLGSGEPFGIANLFGNTPFISEIHAKGSCRVFFFTEAAVRRLLEEDHAFLYQYLAFLSGRIRYLNQKIGYLTAGGAERRLALYLVSKGRDRIVLDASISDLSELLDIGRASLYRAFDRLSADGFLQKEGRTLILPNPDGMLQAYS